MEHYEVMRAIDRFGRMMDITASAAARGRSRADALGLRRQLGSHTMTVKGIVAASVFGLLFIHPSACPVIGAVRLVVAQSATGPTTVDGRPDLSGTWSIDRRLGDDPARATFTPPRSDQQSGGRQGGLGGFGSGGRRGGGGLGRPQGGGQRQEADVLTELETRRLKALTDAVKTGGARLILSHHDPNFVINDASDHTQFFRTTGEGDENHIGTETITSTTHWDEGRLVTAYNISDRMKLSATYTLLARTRQLVVRTTLQRTDTSRSGPGIKLVYSLTPAPAK
jgi:hypothetical protein